MDTWKVLTCYQWNDGPLEFTACLQEEKNPNVYYFRLAGESDDKRLYVSDTNQSRMTPYYVKEENLDFSEMVY